MSSCMMNGLRYGVCHEVVKLAAGTFRGHEFGTCSPLSSSAEPEPSGVRLTGHKSTIVLRINQTEEGQVAFLQPTLHANPANLHEWTAFLAGSDWPSELREDVCLFN